MLAPATPLVLGGRCVGHLLSRGHGHRRSGQVPRAVPDVGRRGRDPPTTGGRGVSKPKDAPLRTATGNDRIVVSPRRSENILWGEDVTEEERQRVLRRR
jgi:hypothetical protein